MIEIETNQISHFLWSYFGSIGCYVSPRIFPGFNRRVRLLSAITIPTVLGASKEVFDNITGYHPIIDTTSDLISDTLGIVAGVVVSYYVLSKGYRLLREKAIPVCKRILESYNQEVL